MIVAFAGNALGQVADNPDAEVTRIRDQVLAEQLDVETAIVRLKELRQKHPTLPRINIYLAKFDSSGREESLQRVLKHTKAFPKTAFLVEREFALQNPEMLERLVKLLDTDRSSFAVEALRVDLNRSLGTMERLYDAPGPDPAGQTARRVKLLSAVREAFVPPALRERVDGLLRRGMDSYDAEVRFVALVTWLVDKKALDETAWHSIEPYFDRFDPSHREYLVRNAARLRDTPQVKSLVRRALADENDAVWHEAMIAGTSRLPYSELRTRLLAALDHESPSVDAAWHYVREPQAEAIPKLRSALDRTRDHGRPQLVAVLALAMARCDPQQLPPMLDDIRPLMQVSRRYVRSRRDVITWLATFEERASAIAPDIRKLADDQPKCYSNVAIALALLQLKPKQPEGAWIILRRLLKSPRPTSRVPTDLPFHVTLEPITEDVLRAVRTQPVNTLYLCRNLAPLLHADGAFEAALRHRLQVERERQPRGELLSPEGKLIQSWLEEEEKEEGADSKETAD